MIRFCVIQANYTCFNRPAFGGTVDTDWSGGRWPSVLGRRLGAGLNGGLFSETMDFRDFPSVLSAVRIAQS